MSDITIAIAAGRTGGHLFPALAVAESLMKLDNDLKLYVIGTSDGIESRIAPKSGYEFHSINAIPLRRSMSIKNLAIPFVLAAGTLQSYLLLRKRRTSAVLATGGFLCVPVLIAAFLAKVKVFMQEQNSYPGLTTRLFARRVDTVFAAYSVVKDYLHPDSNIIQAGNPLRTSFDMGDANEALQHFGLDPGKKTLLIFGGSQGAEAVNRYIADNLGRLKQKADLQLIWQTGSTTFDEFRNRFDESGMLGVAIPFIERMDLAYASADLVISRSGAMTLAELAAAGKPAILIPYPFAAENHQEYNARSVEKNGAAILVKQVNMTEADMIGLALNLVENDLTLKRMAECSRKLHSPGASETIAKIILSEVGK
jgi:UDP-N-acetylglucosamine--N-acetylmuramyl-(pentapeptide) pyrophosphoryl-undecaprenol N-acetylglucosamine transferase